VLAGDGMDLRNAVAPLTRVDPGAQLAPWVQFRLVLASTEWPRNEQGAPIGGAPQGEASIGFGYSAPQDELKSSRRSKRS